MVYEYYRAALKRIAIPFDRYALLRKTARVLNLSQSALTRLEWFIFYEIKARKNALLTCRHFGISRRVFYKWKTRYNPDNLRSLEDQSKSPHRKRQREITWFQEQRIIALRKQHLCWSKFKLIKVYEQEYQESISSWKIQKTIEKYCLYANPVKTAKMTQKRLRGIKKKRITELNKKPRAGFLMCLDAIELRSLNLKRYLFTAIDHFSKVAFARMYKNANSYNAADFLNRLCYLVDGRIENIQTDNGSSFEKYFAQGVKRLKVTRYYSRPYTPKDNSVNERFNRTIQDEFIRLGNFIPDVVLFNKNLTEWLIEYNFKRPHQALNYHTPIQIGKVLPMYPSSTNH